MIAPEKGNRAMTFKQRHADKTEGYKLLLQTTQWVVDRSHEAARRHQVRSSWMTGLSAAAVGFVIQQTDGPSSPFFWDEHQWAGWGLLGTALLAFSAAVAFFVCAFLPFTTTTPGYRLWELLGWYERTTAERTEELTSRLSGCLFEELRSDPGTSVVIDSNQEALKRSKRFTAGSVCAAVGGVAMLVYTVVRWTYLL